ncbi:hypothetical protein EBB07_30495 [Paenibacillaceae bacterium]|nr:hypothetical protein EBB07_30495 [Paenibacillaceae bacterium]
MFYVLMTLNDFQSDFKELEEDEDSLVGDFNTYILLAICDQLISLGLPLEAKRQAYCKDTSSMI